VGSKNYERAAYQERRAAKFLSNYTGETFTRVIGSGRYKDFPGDVEGPRDLIQHKLSSEKASGGIKTIRLNKADLVKIVEQARSKDKKPALIFAFNGDHQLWAVVPLERYGDLINYERP